jgi:GNAT superfamily N-acetyltransferase
MEIIEGTITDLEAIVSLFEKYRVFYKKEPNPNGSKTFIKERITNKDSVIYIAKSNDGQIVAFTQLYPSFTSTRLNKTWILNDLYVEKSHRGQGISKALISRAKRLVKETKAHGLLLETERDNHIANQLYVSTNFKLETNNYYYWEA